jgi:hypothetical protein
VQPNRTQGRLSLVGQGLSHGISAKPKLCIHLLKNDKKQLETVALAF